MIYEMRTYIVKPTTVPEFEARFGEALPHREKYSELGGFWHTEFGPLNQLIQVWPYEDLNERSRIRAEAAKDPQLASRHSGANTQYGFGDFNTRSLHAAAG